MDEDEEDRLGSYREKLFKYSPPKDVGGSPLWVLKWNESTWLAYIRRPKTRSDLTEHYHHIVAKNRAIERRLQMGTWMREQNPGNEHMLPQQIFLEMLDPVPYDEIFDDTEETPEGQAILEQIDMAMAVIGAGGACTVCGAEQHDGHVHHELGCYLPGFAIWRMLHPEDQDRTPSLAMVIQAAQEQIARMQ